MLVIASWHRPLTPDRSRLPHINPITLAIKHGLMCYLESDLATVTMLLKARWYRLTRSSLPHIKSMFLEIKRGDVLDQMGFS